MFNRSMSSRSSIYGDSNIINKEEQDISSCSQETFDNWTIPKVPIAEIYKRSTFNFQIGYSIKTVE